MTPDELSAAADAIQRCYPQIYLACHVDHTRRRSTEHDLSAQDSSYLGHLSRDRAVSPRQLARHLGISDSTLSAFVKRMQDLGYVERAVNPNDRREAELRLTERGEAAMRETSVLDAERLRAVLAGLSSADRRRAVDGIGLLAEACRQAREQYERRRTPTWKPNDDKEDDA